MPKPKLRPRFWWIADQFYLPRYVNRANTDIFFSPDTNLPIWHNHRIKAKTIATIHDLIPVAMKKSYRLPADRALEQKVKFYSTKSANKIITISQYSKRDTSKYLGINPHKIDVVYEAADDSYKPVGDKIKSQIQNKFSGGKPYFLIVGDFYGRDPRKNYILILDGYAKLQSVGGRQSAVGDIISRPTTNNKRHTTNGRPCLLFVGRCGGHGNEYSIIKEQAQKLGIAGNVIFTGFVPDDTLPKIFACAEALLYPSRYEGFGLPIIQAMASGCPIVTTRLTSIPEVAGNAAEYFDINNINSFTQAVINVINNRQRYIKAGIVQAKKFSWAKSAKNIREIIKQI